MGELHRPFRAVVVRFVYLHCSRRIETIRRPRVEVYRPAGGGGAQVTTPTDSRLSLLHLLTNALPGPAPLKLRRYAAIQICSLLLFLTLGSI